MLQFPFATPANSYLYAALAKLPQTAMSIFHQKGKTPSGVYGVDLYVEGIRCPILVDDKLPAYSLEGQDTTRSMWPLIVEKAFAKMHGGYKKMAGGFPNTTLSAITGAPTAFIRHRNEPRIVDLMAANSSSIICASTPAGPSVKGEMPQGLMYGYSYPVIEVINVHTSTTGDVRLVKLYNPWGRSEWKGDWGPNSDKWTPLLRRA